MNLSAQGQELQYCCGVVEIGKFALGDITEHHWNNDFPLETVIKQNETYVFKIATFTNTSQCKKAYEIMCSKLRLVSQTKPKINPNSGNLVFVCVFTNKGK